MRSSKTTNSLLLISMAIVISGIAVATSQQGLTLLGTVAMICAFGVVIAVVAQMVKVRKR